MTRTRRGLIVTAAFAAAVANSGRNAAAEAAATPDSSTAATTQKIHQSGNFRVFYQEQGLHAVAATDANVNDVPDQVEDTLIQTRAAHLFFVRILGFPDPLASQRYRGVSFLDIHLRHKDVLKGNGKAYDEVQRYNRPGDPPGTMSICFNVATSVHPASNATPAHEYFHLVQNGAVYFKNRWYTEGTARWSEHPFRPTPRSPAHKPGEWPLSPGQRATLFGMTYDAANYFWVPLAQHHDATEEFPSSSSESLNELKAMTYVDGSRVIKELRLPGWRFMRNVLLELGKIDDLAFRELDYEKWSEGNQRAPQNDEFIFRAIIQAVKRAEKPATN